MSIPAICCCCTAKTWIIFDAQPWCREHFLAEVEKREAARAEADGPVTADG